MPQKSAFQQIQDHDFWSNSVGAIAEDEDVVQFLQENEGKAEKLLVALNALETTYGQIRTAAEAERDEEEDEDEEEEEDFDEDEE